MKRSDKRGEEGWQIYKMVIAVIILAVLILGGILLFSGRGKELLEMIKNFMRFGR